MIRWQICQIAIVSSDSADPKFIMDARVKPEHDGGGCAQLSPTCPRSPSVPYTICSFLEDLADNGRVVEVVKMFLRAAVAGFACYPGTPADWCFR